MLFQGKIFSMITTIFGGGFGLYGYLPALIQLQKSHIILAARYQEYLKSRNDVGSYHNMIEWESNEEVILKSCDAVILALAPRQQHIIAKKCIGYKNITHIFLEKPLSFSPLSSQQLLSNLKSCGKKFHIGYNFRYTNWGQDLLKNPQNLNTISWNFRAHHYTNNIQTWKKEHENGGGALRYYAIHLIALLAEIGYNDATYSQIVSTQKGEVESWNAELTGDNLHSCKISVDSNSDETNFTVTQLNGDNLYFSQPFQTLNPSPYPNLDQRISFLKSGLYDFFQESSYFNWYDKVNLLWNRIEQKSSF